MSDADFEPHFVPIPWLEPDSVFRLADMVHVPYWKAADTLATWDIGCECEESAKTLLAELRAALVEVELQATPEDTLAWLQSVEGLRPHPGS